MASVAALRARLESSLPERLSSTLLLRERAAPLTVSTGVAALDTLTGGLPRGALSEIAGPASSGRTGVMLAALAGATRQQEVCALVDASDSFDPASAAAVGVDLERLLWVRCSDMPRQKLGAARTGHGRREPVGGILWGQNPRSRAWHNILWCMLLMKTPKLTHTGREKNFRLKPSGSLLLAVGLTERNSPGAMSLLPAARPWLTAGRESFRGKTCSSMATRELPQSDRFRRTDTVCTTWLATYGNGLLTGLSGATPTKSSRLAAAQPSIRALCRLTKVTMPHRRNSGFRARWSKAARTCARPTTAYVIGQRHVSRRWSTPA